MRVTLEVVEGTQQGKSFTFEGYQSFVVGREGQKATEGGLPSDPYMSRHHLLLVIAGRNCSVRDLGSRNGVRVNGKRVREAHLADGDRIRAGRTTLRLHLPKPASSQAAAEPSDRSASLVGDRFADFELLELVGRGSWAEVYRARETRTGRILALKIVAVRPDDEHTAVQHFLREMQIHAGLDHPHIVRTHGVGRSGDGLWLSMDLVEGPTLDAWARKEAPVSEASAVELGSQILSALTYAHARGVIHRDVKPGNILLDGATGDMRARLADFGLAKCYQDSGAPCLTSTGVTKGTPRCMPPEQIINAKNVGPAADIYAVGASLYYALTLEWHFVESECGPWASILSGQPVPLRERRPDIDPTLAGVVDRSLSPNPQDRPGSTEEMRHELLSLGR